MNVAAHVAASNLYYRFWSGNNDIGFLAVLGGVRERCPSIFYIVEFGAATVTAFTSLQLLGGVRERCPSEEAGHDHVMF